MSDLMPALMPALRHRLRPLWGGQGAGAVWLALAVGSTFVLGLAVQVLGLRLLSEGDYATFVLALGIGNVAAAIAASVQPVVASRAHAGERSFLPASIGPVAAGAAVATLAGAAVLAPAVGPSIALLAMVQIPLHAAVGAGLGRLQAGRSFRRIATANVLWSCARLLIVAPWVLAAGGSATAFVLALPAALAVELLLLRALGAYRGLGAARASDASWLLRNYALWALFAWLLNADAIYARLFLTTAGADAYAVAFTLGRQPVYAVAPLAIVLLPVTLSSTGSGQRARLHAILIASLLLLAATWLVLGVRPELLVRFLSGGARSVDPTLVRGYALVGSLAALATLELTFVFALGRLPALGRMAFVALASGAVAAALVSGPHQLLIVQGAVVGTLAVELTWLAFRASAPGVRTPLRLVGVPATASDATYRPPESTSRTA